MHGYIFRIRFQKACASLCTPKKYSWKFTEGNSLLKTTWCWRSILQKPHAISIFGAGFFFKKRTFHFQRDRAGHEVSIRKCILYLISLRMASIRAHLCGDSVLEVLLMLILLYRRYSAQGMRAGGYMIYHFLDASFTIHVNS